MENNVQNTERLNSSGINPKKGVLNSVFEWAEEFVIAIVAIFIIFTFIFRIITVDGESMEPNYLNGNRVLVSSNSMNITQGDVVIIVNVLDGPIIKRVIATEGQTIDIDENSGSVIVDGQVLDNTQFGVENGITFPAYSNYIATEFPATVPEGCVFVLGDNRTVSKDSRYSEVGMIDERNILGKAIFHFST